MTKPSDINPRQDLIQGLRDLATYLDQHPDLPTHHDAQITYCVPAIDDPTGITRLTAIADAIGAPVTDVGGRRPTPDTTHFYAVRRFGPVRYEANYIRRAEMDTWRALMSYTDNIQPTPPDQPTTTRTDQRPPRTSRAAA